MAIFRQIPAAMDSVTTLWDYSTPFDGLSRRIDYNFVSDPSEALTFRSDFTRPRRVRYEQQPDASLRRSIELFSDHLGVSTYVALSKK